MKNDIFWSDFSVRIWRTGRHTPTKNSQKHSPGFKPIKKFEKSDLKINKYSVKTGPLADNYSHWVAALEFVTKAVQLIT